MSLTANELRYLIDRGYDGFVAYNAGGRRYVGKVKTVTDYDAQLATVQTLQHGGDITEHRIRKMALSAATKQQVREYYDRIAVDYETWRASSQAERASDTADCRAIQFNRRTG